MALISSRENVDKLINHFWQNGYLTVSRKFGTYLPAPQPVGTYTVDAVGRYKRKFAIGIILNEEDLSEKNTAGKLIFLATRQTKFSNTKVTLFVGIEPGSASKAKALVDALPDEARRNIKLVFLSEKRFSQSSTN